MLFVFIVVAASGAAFALWLWDVRGSPLAGQLPVSVVGAAIRYCDLGVVALPLPKSHHDIREMVERMHGSRTGKHRGEIGYIVDRGGFVKAQEALVIARQARQLRKVPLKGDVLELDYLFSAGKDAPAPAPARRQPRAAPRYKGSALWMTRTAAAGQIVTSEHLHREFLRTALVTIPCLFLAGLISLQFGIDRFSGVLFQGFQDGGMPRLAWTLSVGQCALYALLGLGLASVIHARGAQLRGYAVAAFSALVVVNLLWAFSFSAGVDTYSTLLVAVMIVLAPLTVALFGLIRFKAALLTVPSLAWTGLATYATLQVYLGTS